MLPSFHSCCLPPCVYGYSHSWTSNSSALGRAVLTLWGSLSAFLSQHKQGGALRDVVQLLFAGPSPDLYFNSLNLLVKLRNALQILFSLTICRTRLDAPRLETKSLSSSVLPPGYNSDRLSGNNRDQILKPKRSHRKADPDAAHR